MSVISSLVPARFLTLIAHLVIVITIFWSRENNVRASLPLQFTEEEYDKEDIRLVIALSITLGLFFIELAGFFSGVSMFNSSQGLLSTGCHASASVALLFFLFEQWTYDIYWWIFAFCRLKSPWHDPWLVYLLASLTIKPALAAHCSASICLSFFVFQKWQCWTYWFIFAFCSVIPALVELTLFIAVFGLKKKPF